MLWHWLWQRRKNSYKNRYSILKGWLKLKKKKNDRLSLKLLNWFRINEKRSGAEWNEVFESTSPSSFLLANSLPRYKFAIFTFYALRSPLSHFGKCVSQTRRATVMHNATIITWNKTAQTNRKVFGSCFLCTSSPQVFHVSLLWYVMVKWSILNCI